MSDETIIPKKENKKLSVRLFTFGCQMNEYDSQVARGVLEAAGYEIVKENEHRAESKGRSFPASVIASEAKQSTAAVIASATLGTPPRNDGTSADVILMNTCSVREHAEERVYGRLGRLGKVKKENPNLIIGLMGCMVEEHREKLFKRFPQLDFMVGTRNIRELPVLIEQAAKSREQVARIKQDGISIEYTDLIKRENKFHAWLPVMTGCDKVCTYCIVPITRGREVSMPAREVYREASRLVGEGVKWITLLGQNVNSYNGNVIARSAPYGVPNGKATKQSTVSSPNALIGDPLSLDSRQRHSGMTNNEIASASFGALPRPPEDVRRRTDPSEFWRRSAFLRADNDGTLFPDLLDLLCQIDGLERISFTTSHPHDATEELFRVIARNPKISRRFHLPLQTGSNRILKRMKRLHTYEEYKAKIDSLRSLVPDISITTDIIAGFSGETEEDYQATVRALEEIRYDGAYIYKYSVRPATPAAKLPDDVPLPVKETRNRELLAVQKRITEEENNKWIGRSVCAFVEGTNPRDAAQLISRTDQDKKVVLEGSSALVGRFVEIALTGLRHETFFGVLNPKKGDQDTLLYFAPRAAKRVSNT